MSIAPSANADWGPFIKSCFFSVSATLNISVTQWRNAEAAKAEKDQRGYVYFFAEIAYGAIAVGGVLEAVIRLVCSVRPIKYAFSFKEESNHRVVTGNWSVTIPAVIPIVIGESICGYTPGSLILGGAFASAGTAVDAACSLLVNNL